MFKYYYFYSYSKLDKPSFNEIIRKSYSYYIDIEFSDDNNGIIMADENFSVRLLNIYNILLNDLGIAVVFLETFDLNNLSELSMKNLIFNKEKGVFSLDEVILKAYLYKNKEIANALEKIFDNIDEDLLDCASYYLKCNLNASIAANSLYIHRNTFNYRLNKFIEISKLDIRDYKNSLIFYFYLIFKHQN